MIAWFEYVILYKSVCSADICYLHINRNETFSSISIIYILTFNDFQAIVIGMATAANLLNIATIR